ncbi:Carboxypeptidase [Mycena venus]|uniref:Carboxypeptidase n=1 Tax=Mycena venus TaxID=2733690 RepID=A0A8H6Z2N6_9AGAR|nr:Carboxypeptidase [Mycena venus]
MPTTDFGPDWQPYFEVTGLFPNLTKIIPRSFAGNVGVNRAGHPNATLFFWAFEKANGSLTNDCLGNDDPWIIWLNGGPGASSLLGLLTENGPLRVTKDYAVVKNNYSWHQLADTIWVDQPVGTGYATTDPNGYVPDEDQMGVDFVGFLSNLVKIFPCLDTRPLYLTGESYAGTQDHQPYITKTLFSTPNPPVRLKRFAIGDGTLGSRAVHVELPTLTTIETYPQLINYDPEVYEYFKTQEHLCGYDLNLTYPQNGHFPTLVEPSEQQVPSTSFTFQSRLKKNPQALLKAVWRWNQPESFSLNTRETEHREERRQQWKRGIANRPNGTLDPTYGCHLFEEMWDYAVNFSSPWAQVGAGGKDVYNIPDALDPEIPSDATTFLNDKTVKAAIHAPISKDWQEDTPYPFGGQFIDPSPEPMVFLSDLASEAREHAVGMIFYSGNDDSLIAHRGTEVIIQNITWGGVQGFTRKPSTPFTDDQGNFAGIIHQERGLKYVLFQNAGHLVPQSVPGVAFTFVRDFVLGFNNTGEVDNPTESAVGGEDPNLMADALPGNPAIYWASKAGEDIASTVAPSATRAAWDAFLATATAVLSADGPQSSGSTSGTNNAAVG